MESEVTYSLAFLAGVVSFVSACVLPLVPSYVSLVTGMSFEDLTAAVDRKRVRLLTLVNSSLFILGFSAVFIALGASSSYAGKILFQYQEWIRIIGGILVIVFGLFIAGVLNVRFLMREKRFHPKGRPPGTVGAFFIGTAFAAGWTPCIGPILGSILLVASSSGSAVYGVKLLSVYSAGLAIPFLLSSLAFNTFLSYSKTLLRYMRPIKVASGVLMIVFGVVLLTDQLGTITGWFPGLDVTL
jgi:cytochrome c-type biogenesis protein